jgi:hypothetical protein
MDDLVSFCVERIALDGEEGKFHRTLSRFLQSRLINIMLTAGQVPIWNDYGSSRWSFLHTKDLKKMLQKKWTRAFGVDYGNIS